MGKSPFKLKVKEGPGSGKSIKVKTEALVLGSGPEADIRVEGPGVEPRHAQVVFDGGQVKLEDLGTRSGTFRNGQRLLGPVRVFPGDRVGLGPEVVLILEGDDPRQGQKEGGLADSVAKAIDHLTGGDEEEGEQAGGEAAGGVVES